MVARIVPVVRLRRNTGHWSYTVPANITVRPGQLVRVPFRGVVVAGAVWEVVEYDAQATQTIDSVISDEVFVRPPARHMIEVMSERGLCSLSTALYVWLPPGLRTAYPKLPRLNGLGQGVQHGVCIAGQRPQQERMLRGHVSHLFADTEQFSTWMEVNGGVGTTGIGREGALFAPWRDLQGFTLVEPEDISFYHESTPYMPLTDLLKPLSESYRISPTVRSFLPSPAAQMLWGKVASGNDRVPSTIWHIDRTGQPLIPPALLDRVRKALADNQPVIILLNAYDRFIEADDGRRKKKVGVESLPAELALALGLAQLPTSIQIGTRSLFHAPLPLHSLGIIFSLQSWLAETPIGDRLHGWSDVGRLLANCEELILMSRSPADPFVQSLLCGTWSDYLLSRLKRLQSVGLPPFCEQVALSIRGKEHPQAVEVYNLIAPLLREPWHGTQPFTGQWRKTTYTHILLTAPTGSRLPTAARAALVALERPWKVQRNPWHTL